MLETFTVGMFGERLGESFRIYPDASNPLEVELVSATGPEANAAGGRPFSIVFRGPRGIPLPQRLYRMEHTGIGSFDLFLVPIGPDEKGLLYEAVFN